VNGVTLPAAVAEIERFCAKQTPPSHRHQMRLEAEVRGRAGTIADCRPPWDGDHGEWTRTEFARLRYDQSSGHWTLYWADSNDRWHRYEDLPRSGCDGPSREIANDPTGIFLG
jgi:hypothetical protein